MLLDDDAMLPLPEAATKEMLLPDNDRDEKLFGTNNLVLAAAAAAAATAAYTLDAVSHLLLLLGSKGN